jgi:hypothetical protein
MPEHSNQIRDIRSSLIDDPSFLPSHAEKGCLPLKLYYN